MARAFSEAELEAMYREAEQTRQSTPTATGIHYDVVSQCFTITLLAGGKVSFEAAQVPELAGATSGQLAEVELSPSGGGIHWPQLDMDISVTGLVMDLVAGEGWRRGFRALLMREITGAKSEKKAAAARVNGRKGGRPRKTARVDGAFESAEG